MSKPHYPTRTDTRLTSPFGWRTHPISKKRVFHFGIDLAPRIAGTPGLPVYAVRPGVVREVFFNNARGWTVRIEHSTETRSSGYQHLAAGSIQVKVGDRVTQGQRIATMGTTGASTGIHLHFEVISGNRFTQAQGPYLDPVTYLNTAVNRLAVDGKWGPATERAWQEADKMAVVDGKINHQFKSVHNEHIHAAQFDKSRRGSNHIRTIQRRLGEKADGLCGPRTISAMQRNKGMRVVDGKISDPVSEFVKAVQRDLNAGRNPIR